MATNGRSRVDRDAHATVKPIALRILTTPPIPTGSSVHERNSVTMASNTDAAYVEDVDVDQALRARNNTSKSHRAPVFRPDQANKSGASSQDMDIENEDAPLLSPTDQDYGSGNGRRDSENEYEYEWEGARDFEGLPWWKKPSVRYHNSIQNGIWLT